MTSEQQPQEGAAEVSQDSLDFSQFEKWRETGELPQAEEKASSEGSEEQPETDPEPDPEDKQEQPEEQPEAEKGKGKGGFQRRIDKLTREKYELAQRLEAIEQRLADPAAAKSGQPAPAEGKPKVDGFESYEEYIEALTGWKVEQKSAIERKAEAERAAAEQQKAVLSQWEQRLEAARSKHEDFDDVIESDVPVSPAMQQALLDSEQGADLAYFLGKNPKEAERIAGLSPVAQIRELGKLEAKLAATEATKLLRPGNRKPARRRRLSSP